MNLDKFDTQNTDAWEKLNKADCERIIRTYLMRFWDLEKTKALMMISIFRNYGRDAGASQPHPHSQIMATSVVPLFVRHEIEQARRHYDTERKCVFCEIARRAIRDFDHASVTRTRTFVVLEPFASRFPLETWVIPRIHQSSFGDLGKGDLSEYDWKNLKIEQKIKRAESDVQELAEVLSDTLVRMHVVLGDFPYNYMIHTAPLDDRASNCYHWHIKIFPRLTMPAGYEWATDVFVNPTLPEEAARCLARVNSSEIIEWRKKRKEKNECLRNYAH
jgi:UDPglucose--hexose-1-phosphate uridylyltransferase